MITSASSSPSSTRYTQRIRSRRTYFSISGGTHIAGPHRVMRQPNLLSRWMFERATRDWAIRREWLRSGCAAPLAIADRQRIEQALRGMFVRAVAGVNHRNLQALGHEFRRARRGVSDHNSVRLHRVQSVRTVSINDSPFLRLEDSACKAHRIRTKARRGSRETDASASGCTQRTPLRRSCRATSQVFLTGAAEIPETAWIDRE